jgi:hypothetical protein
MSNDQNQRPLALKATARVAITQGVLKMLDNASAEFVKDLCQQLMYENMVRMSDQDLVATFHAMEEQVEKQASLKKEEADAKPESSAE